MSKVHLRHQVEGKEQLLKLKEYKIPHCMPSMQLGRSLSIKPILLVQRMKGDYTMAVQEILCNVLFMAALIGAMQEKMVQISYTTH